MKTLGYYNGKFGELDEMTVPMNDRVCWFGDGVYDAGPARNYKIFAIDEHIDRFFNSAGLLDMKMPVTKQELKDLLQEMVNKRIRAICCILSADQRNRDPESCIYRRSWKSLDHAETG